MVEPDSSKKVGLKSWRIMVKNLPFDTTVEELQNEFAKYGKLLDIKLPKCLDKRFPKSCAGFCFLQYAKKKSADFALKGIMSDLFKGRMLRAQFALSKDTYVMKRTAETNEKQKLEDKLKKILGVGGSKSKAGKKVVNQDLNGETNKRTAVVKTELADEDESKEDEDDYSTEYSRMDVDKEEDEEAITSEEQEDDDQNEDEDTDSDNDEKPKEEQNSDSEEQESNLNKELKKAPRKDDIAVLEGRVVFLRNLDFNASVKELKETAARFGEVTLAIQCKYPGTDQPTGTAFVHFRDKSAADAFLNQLLKYKKSCLQPDGVEVNGRQLYGYRAVPRATAVAEFATWTKKEPKDKRNLQLMRASLIREGAAETRGMSESDVQLRKRLILVAKNKLKDLTKFVSPIRLAIHNIPFTMNDNQLRTICLAAAKNPKAKVVEARIMRDTLGCDERGRVKLGRSKGFGFVAFSEHTDALACLRALNNNPKTFTDERRPIVEFSIENLNAIQAKERRIEDFKRRLEEKQSANATRLGNRRKTRFTPSSLLNDPLALLETKRQLMSGGKKWLPKRLGQKVRHRDLKNPRKADPRAVKVKGEAKKRAASKPLRKPAAKRFKK